MPKAKRRLHPEYPHHITARTNNRVHFPIPMHQVWSIFEDHLYLLDRGFNCQIISFVLMPNHFHLILRDPKLNLSSAMQYFMRETSKEINREAGTINRVWGGNFHSSLICSLPYYYTAYKYVYQNPVRAGLCDQTLDYKFSTLHSLFGLRHSAIPLAEDLTLFESVGETLSWLNERYKPHEEIAIKQSLSHSEMTFSTDRVTRKPIDPRDFLTHPRYQKV